MYIQRLRLQDAPPPQKPTSRSLEYSAYLNPAGYLETRYTRMMASLSSIAYRMDRLTPAYLRRMQNIELRHTSLACEIGFENEVVSSERQMAEDVDTMGDGATYSDHRVRFKQRYLLEPPFLSRAHLS